MTTFIHSSYQRELLGALKESLGVANLFSEFDNATKQLIDIIKNKNNLATNSLQYRNNVIDAINKYKPIPNPSYSGMLFGQTPDSNKIDIVKTSLTDIINKEEYNTKSLNRFDTEIRNAVNLRDTFKSEASSNLKIWNKQQKQHREQQAKKRVHNITSYRGWFPSGAHMQQDNNEPLFNELNLFSPKRNDETWSEASSKMSLADADADGGYNSSDSTAEPLSPTTLPKRYKY